MLNLVYFCGIRQMTPLNADENVLFHRRSRPIGPGLWLPVRDGIPRQAGGRIQR